MTERDTGKVFEGSVMDVEASVQTTRLGSTEVTAILGAVDIEKVIRFGCNRVYIQKVLPFVVVLAKEPMTQ